MVFVHRQIESLVTAGVVGRSFHVASRTSPRLIVREWLRLRAEIRAFRPGLVHAQYGTVTGFLCACATTLPLVISYRGSDLNPSSDKSRLRCLTGRLLSQLTALRARRIICVSKALLERLWWRRQAATVIPSGVDTRTFFPRLKAETRSLLGWKQENRVVLFNGADRIVKRPDLARAAVEVARSLCGAIELVELDGTQSPEQVALLMNGSDCLVLTSDYEGSPNVVKEAIACALPVVSFGVGDVRERLYGVEPSQIVSGGPEEVGCALADILVRGERSNGADKMKDLSLESVAEQVLAVYRTVVGDCAGSSA